jgi:hypothetical protein
VEQNGPSFGCLRYGTLMRRRRYIRMSHEVEEQLIGHRNSNRSSLPSSRSSHSTYVRRYTDVSTN